MSWGTTLTDLSAYLPTPYKLTPKWVPFFVKVWSYPNEELYPNVDPAFNPVLFDEVQNAALYMAEDYQECFEFALQYVIIPGVIGLSSNMALWALQKLASGAASALLEPGDWIPEERTVPPKKKTVPPKKKSAFDFIKRAIKSIYNSKIVSYFIVPEVVSHIMHDRGLKQFYKDMRPVMKAFMRPFYERVIPSLFGSLDKGDVGTSFRKWVIDDKPSWYNSVMDVVFYPTHCLGLIFKADPVPKTWAEINRPYAYQLGKEAVGQVERGVEFVKDIFWSTTQILPSLSSWEDFTQATTKLAKYFEVQLDWLDANWEPISSAVKSWVGTGIEALGNMLKSTPSVVANLIANTMTEEDNSWTRTAAQGVGYIPTMLVAVYATYAAVLAVQAGFRAIRNRVYPGGIASSRNIIQFAGDVPALAPAPAPAPALAPAPAPLVPPVDLQAHLIALLSHAPVEHDVDWQAMPQAERAWLNQQLINNPDQLHQALVAMGINNGDNEAIVNGLALNP